MKKTKTKIILSAIIFLSVIGFVGTANAAGASLYIAPATLTKTAGDTFSASVGFNASGSKVCAVEGTLVFDNLSCQSIAVSGDADIVAQSSPTCLNPHFLIGIQNCTTSDRVLLTASVKAGSAGTASVSATGVDIIGEGASVGSASTSGNYTINAVVVPTPTPKTTTVTKPQTVVTQPTQQTTQEVVTQEVITPTEEVAQEPSVGGQQASLVTASPAKTITIVVVILLAIVVIGGGWYMYSKKNKK